jgi:5-formyltetrahydrofolate cyclo-ligase
MTSKKELRAQFKTILGNLDQRWVSAASHRLSRRLDIFFKESSISRVRNILCFAAFFSGEVDLTSFISNQLDHRNVYLPRVSADGSMVFISISRNWQEASGSGGFGIPEPGEGGQIFNFDEADETAVIIPGMVFDEFGNRLGRGKGYYDRFLQSRQSQALHCVGVAWDMQVLATSIPTEKHDVLMNWIVTEERTIQC